MPAIGGFSGWIQVDGKPLQEYQVEYSPDGTQATCWIPSEVGKEFQIGYLDSVGALTTATKVYVDGTYCSGQIIYPRHSERYRTSVAIQKGSPVSESAVRPFVFAACQLLDDDNLLMNSPAIGQIKVVIEEIQVREVIGKPFEARNLPPLRIHERAKKGIVHGIQLGNVVQVPPARSRGSTTLRIVAVLVFKYRPLDFLIADGIVPSPNPPPRKPLSTAEDVIDLTLDDEEPRRPRRKRRGDIKTELKRERSITFDDTIIDLTL